MLLQLYSHLDWEKCEKPWPTTMLTEKVVFDICYGLLIANATRAKSWVSAGSLPFLLCSPACSEIRDWLPVAAAAVRFHGGSCECWYLHPTLKLRRVRWRSACNHLSLLDLEV